MKQLAPPPHDAFRKQIFLKFTSTKNGVTLPPEKRYDDIVDSVSWYTFPHLLAPIPQKPWVIVETGVRDVLIEDATVECCDIPNRRVENRRQTGSLLPGLENDPKPRSGWRYFSSSRLDPVCLCPCARRTREPFFF